MRVAAPPSAPYLHNTFPQQFPAFTLARCFSAKTTKHPQTLSRGALLEGPFQRQGAPPPRTTRPTLFRTPSTHPRLALHLRTTYTCTSHTQGHHRGRGRDAEQTQEGISGGPRAQQELCGLHW
jgi:hypothetical protein